jgi:RNA polymerase sigma-70 factor (ECF subfamily)
VLNQLTEKDLTDQIKKGNIKAFNELVKRFEKPVSNVIIGMLGNTPEAEIIAQDVFIRFYQTVDNFRQESGLRTYLTRMAINMSLNEIKRQKRLKKKITFGDEAYLQSKGSENPGENFDLKEAVQKALDVLDSKHRAVIILRLIEGYSTKETAKILKIPQGTVLSRLFRAQEQLRELLKDYL